MIEQQPRVEWGPDGFASASGWALAHCANELHEYFSSQDVWISVGTGLPASSYLDPPPPAKPGMAIVRAFGAWTLVDDLRGNTAFNKQTRQAVFISELGPLAPELTLVRPESQFDTWDEKTGSWVKDNQAECEWLTQQATYHRSYLLNEASNEITALLDALDPAVISDPDDAVQTKLLEWKQYRASLAVIDCTVHPVQWPVKPQ